MVLSPAEKSYIYDSLIASTPLRPDSRKPQQFRPLKATCSILPNANGSSRIYTADGIECLSSIKTRVVRVPAKKAPLIEDLIHVAFEIQGQRDDTTLVTHTCTLIKQSLLNLNINLLKLTQRYYYELHIDVVILAVPNDFGTNSYTLNSLVSLGSMSVYLALKSTKLPLVTSQVEGDLEEEPTFSDDWESSELLFKNDEPVLLFVVGIAGSNVIIDPSLEEQQVLDHGLCIGWKGECVSPIESLLMSKEAGKAINQALIFKSLDLIKQIGNEVINALDTIASQEVDAFQLAF
ncbi:exosome non-catalytic core subunit [Martiniozyma asiatica (nom. inval.)]|nr:exosome non-catalytic core subunit [Martiniozyma asiatica]